MEKRIELEKRGRRPNQITELNLDNCRSTSIVGLTDEFTALESLSLINVGLTTLKGFPNLPNLRKLELSDNRISNGLNYLTKSPKLTHLNLSGNKIKDLETLKPLESFTNLEVLDLFNNEATAVENYREKIFAMIPSLKYLDGFDANEVEASSEGEDDDEVNGNDSEDEEYNKPMFINGLEIDLDELEKFELKLKAKNKLKLNSLKNNDDDDDDLDIYLEKLKIQENEQNILEGQTTDNINNINNDDNDEEDKMKNESSPSNYNIHDDNSIIISNNCNMQYYSSSTSSTSTSTTTNITTSTSTTTTTTTSTSNLNNSSSHNEKNETTTTINLPLLLYVFMATLSLVSYACFSDEMGEDEDDGEDDDDEEDESDEDDNGDVSLAEVYNDDLEEGNSEWGEKGEGEEEEDDDVSDEEDDETDNQKEAETPEESQARGKKRKLDG